MERQAFSLRHGEGLMVPPPLKQGSESSCHDQSSAFLQTKPRHKSEQEKCQGLSALLSNAVESDFLPEPSGRSYHRALRRLTEKNG
jgi:hypothetical protein